MRRCPAAIVVAERSQRSVNTDYFEAACDVHAAEGVLQLLIGLACQEHGCWRDSLTCMPRSKKRRRGGSTRRRPQPPDSQRFRAPKTRLKGLLALLIDVPAIAEQMLATTPLPEEESAKRLAMFDAGVLIRASNALKAVGLLCAQAHWEFAAAIVRQLFELVINMEYLATQPDRERAIFVYAKYGLLQRTRRQQLDLLYEQKTGRRVDAQRLAVLEKMLEDTFPEFRRVTAQGTVRWLPSWSGHSARYLATQSKNPLREAQYQLLFAAWSEQAHAAPAALMDNMFPRGISAERAIAADDAEIVQTVTMAITLFFELWTLLPRVAQIDPARRLELTTRMVAEARKHGAPLPAQPAVSSDGDA